MQNYEPAQIAKSQNQPMLILQGELDFQVTMQDFQIWKDALGSRRNITFKSYPSLTHLFMEGAGGKPGLKDYEKTNHVNQRVISDITDWILKQ